MNTLPDISIIVPIYKTQPHFLTTCLDSLITQTHENIEIIIVADGSPQNIIEICKQYENKYINLKLIIKQNEGVSIARNIGIATAQGTWIMFVDADDWIESTTCAKMLKTTTLFEQKKAKKLDILFFPYIKEYLTLSKNVHFFIKSCEYTNPKEISLLLQLSLHIHSGLGSVWAKLYNTHFIKKTNVVFNPNLSIGEDVEFNFKLIQQAENIIYAQHYLYHYRYDEQSISNVFNKNFEHKHYNLAFALKKAINQYNGIDKKKLWNAFYARTISSILAIALRQIFSEKNTISSLKKIDELKNLCQKDIFKDAIQKAPFHTLPPLRRLALFFLKIRCYYCISIIVKLRTIQYKHKIG